MQEILLATDLDETLIGDDAALKSLNILLSELRAKSHLKLAYVTGRSLESYDLLVAEKSLLTPDVLVTSVGTEIYWNTTDLSREWPQVIELDSRAIMTALHDIPNLTLQPEIAQRPYRIAYYLKADIKTLALIKRRLDNFSVDVIYSHQEYLDILPKGVNKGSSLAYLAAHWNIDIANIIACGNSANDIDMLRIGKAIVVANSRQELLDWVFSQEPTENVYLAKQGYAAGITEGVKNFQRLQ